MSWTACYDNSCPIHRSEKEGAGWHPKKLRRVNATLRILEQQEIDDFVEMLSPDENLVNSDTGELYDSTPESSEAEEQDEVDKTMQEWFEKGTNPLREDLQEAPEEPTLQRIREHLAQYGSTRWIHENRRTINWVPNPSLDIPTQQYQYHHGTLWQRAYLRNRWSPWKPSAARNAPEVADWLRDEARNAQIRKDRQHLQELAQILGTRGTITLGNDRLHWRPHFRNPTPPHRY